MQNKNEFLATVPFDIYELHLVELVARFGSFTKAGQQVGLTQSAVTRQIRSMEDQLGVALFERTTRRVGLTPAGRFLHQNADAIVRDVSRVLQHLRENFANAPKTISVGFSRSIGLAYFPGFFVSFRKKFPAIQTQVFQRTSTEILSGLEANELQVGVLGAPSRLPRGLKITHRFDDDFTLIAPPETLLPSPKRDARMLLRLLADHNWLLINEQSNTGRALRTWLRKMRIAITPAMEIDSFDLIVNLVAMGMGVSLVPHRALPLYPKSRSLQRFNFRPKFSRELVVVVRKDRKPPAHITAFIEHILF